MKRDPRRSPRKGDRVAKLVTNRLKLTTVQSRTVLALEQRYPRGTTVVYTRKHPKKPCRCSLSEWRQWTKGASLPR